MFHRPIYEGLPVGYFCGHSLGLQPASTKEYLQLELDKWANQGVEGHFEEPNPWLHYHHFAKKGLSQLCGAFENEVVPYGSLSANLHFMFASFYTPTTQRFKILAEDTSFPSDTFALQTHTQFRGYDPKEAILWLRRDADYQFSTDYILRMMELHKEELALVWLSGVNFLSGQVHDMQAIAQKAFEYGIKIGIDLAHAIGNVPLQLHDWGIDFAVWCSYKYLNAGPGAVGGYFVHQRNFPTVHTSLLAGWWGHQEESRFQIEQGFQPIANADAWQHSNANVLSLAALRASLDVFLTTSITDLHTKSLVQTNLAIDLLQDHKGIQLLTPPTARGNMLAVFVKQGGKEMVDRLKSQRLVVDWREPGILRFSFCPLYNTPQEWKQFLETLQEIL